MLAALNSREGSDMKESASKPTPPPVSLKRVAEELDMLPGDTLWRAYLNRRTGETYTVTDEDSAAVEDPGDRRVPDWQREQLPKVREVLESDEWIMLPSKYDLHEYGIMKSFCLELGNQRRRAELLDAIAGRGAFRAFKNLVHRYGLEQSWYGYRTREIERFVAEWLDAQRIAYDK